MSMVDDPNNGRRASGPDQGAGENRRRVGMYDQPEGAGAARAGGMLLPLLGLVVLIVLAILIYFLFLR